MKDLRAVFIFIGISVVMLTASAIIRACTSLDVDFTAGVVATLVFLLVGKEKSPTEVGDKGSDPLGGTGRD